MNKAKTSPEEVPFIAVLPAQSRASLLRNSVVHTVHAGTIIFAQGDLPTFQHVVLSGSVHLLGRSGRQKEVLIETVEPPDLLLPAAVVTKAPYLLTARAPELSQLMLIQADSFRQAVLQSPSLAEQVIGSLAGQFRRLLRQIKNLKLRNGVDRVGCYLVALAAHQKNAEQISLPYEKNLIASELGMTPESFSRALLALQQEGIAVRGDQIVIRDIRQLAATVGVDPLIDDLEVTHFLSTLEPSGKHRPARTARKRSLRSKV